MFRVRDFVETRDGLLFSVVSNHHPPSGILAQLRYRRTASGLRKIESSDESYRFLSRSAPQYLRFCLELDRELTIVPRRHVIRHFQPVPALAQLIRLGQDPGIASIVSELASRSGVGTDDLGITGSYLVEACRPSSDIDLVVYGLSNYRRLTNALRECVQEGTFSPLDRRDWASIYRRRVPDRSTYSFREFIWHESRKWNRAKLDARIFDILSARRFDEISGQFGDHSFKRLGRVTAECWVSNSALGFDYPARYAVSDCYAHGYQVSEIVSFTHTYLDQVREGERVVCSGILEAVSGKERYYRILVGSTREACGEFLKVKGAALAS